MKSKLSPLNIAKAFGRHDFRLPDSNFKERLLQHPILQGLYTIGDYFLMVSNMQNMEIEYMGGEVEKITGYSWEEVSRLRGDFYAVFTFQEDAPFLLEVIGMSIQYHQNRPVEERERIYVVYYYRAKKKNGQVVVIQHQSIPIFFDSQMTPYIFANILTDITHLSVTRVPQSTLINRYSRETFHIYPENLKLTKPKDLFTTREKEIIKLLINGFSSGLIAQQLFISKETVRTHRKNILKKANLNSTSQLVGYALTNAIF